MAEDNDKTIGNVKVGRKHEKANDIYSSFEYSMYNVLIIASPNDSDFETDISNMIPKLFDQFAPKLPDMEKPIFQDGYREHEYFGLITQSHVLLTVKTYKDSENDKNPFYTVQFSGLCETDNVNKVLDKIASVMDPLLAQYQGLITEMEDS